MIFLIKQKYQSLPEDKKEKIKELYNRVFKKPSTFERNLKSERWTIAELIFLAQEFGCKKVDELIDPDYKESVEDSAIYKQPTYLLNGKSIAKKFGLRI